MGQSCSCLQHPHKYQRQPSDDHNDLDIEQSEDGQELDMVEGHELLRTRIRTNSNGRNSLWDGIKRLSLLVGIGNSSDAQNEAKKALKEPQLRHSRPSMRLMGHADHLLTPSARPEELLIKLLRLYQEKTGVIDEGQLELECIMCLDTFNEENPKVRTLCHCGMNRTNFHMSCLLEWLNRNANCPVCREYLFFEDT
ncbi:uncharacterized protein CCR75_000615 [Bremia lactucae]|uniref:RING-type E3 ubiquitin transferase n=1 Tax=Bremia lactucae TaxID=4779 RepID=A0A976FDN4_BRELC|nr:hypothetical protein CCR75_000615 [Bremia lactucae]